MRQGGILGVLRNQRTLSATRIREALLGAVSLATVKREMAILISQGLVASSGFGRGAGYALTRNGEFFAPIDAHAYCAKDPDTRGGFEQFDGALITEAPTAIFTDEERGRMDATTSSYHERASAFSETLAKKELERFVIELSWKSSRIEGNTYTLLDTERLIREGVEAKGRTHEEALMILNHKRAFEFILTHKAFFVGTPKKSAIEEVHRLLTEGLRVGAGVRRQVVGIIGTRYRPPDNSYHINEAIRDLMVAIGNSRDPYTAALLTLAGLSYIQPFEDGNKRTARLTANGVLFARGRVPLSYRGADETDYREAILVFYETHSIIPLKNLFLKQYLFAAEQYGLK